MATKKANPSWSDVKDKLVYFDRDDLLGLVQEIYDASRGNQALLHVRLRLDVDVLKPYKATIERWLWPDVFKNQEVSVSKAKKAIADFKKAGGTAEGLAELMVFYCEKDSGFCDDVGQDDESHFNALVRMFERALEAIATLPAALRTPFLERLVVVRRRSHNIGYGLGDEMADLLAKHGLHD
jgi:hypothetical protein